MSNGRDEGGRFSRLAWARQVHGNHVLLAPGAPAGNRPSAPPAWQQLGVGDALIGTNPDVATAVFTADCGAVALASDRGEWAAVHAGWRGLEAGVVERAVEAMVDRGASSLTAADGPCIHPECYEFAEDDLRGLEDRFGPGVRSVTAAGTLAFDLPRALRTALEQLEVSVLDGEDVCTACSPRFFSHRARGDTGRQALVMWSVAS